MSAPSLLPPNATALELALESVLAVRINALDAPLRALWRADAIPPDFLPFVAWGLSVDEWNKLWGVEQQRTIIAAAIEVQRHKGTLGSVRRVLIAAGCPDAIIHEGLYTWRVGAEHSVGEPGLTVQGPAQWAVYAVYPGRFLTEAQAASLVRMLNATAPARCRLLPFTPPIAPWVVGDGSLIGQSGLEVY